MSKKTILALFLLSTLIVMVILLSDKKKGGDALSSDTTDNQTTDSKIEISKDEYKDFLRYLEVRDIEERIVRTVKLFDMPEDQDILDITDRILSHEYYQKNQDLKRHVIDSHRRFYIFRYPSDEFNIIGHVSFIPDIDANNTKSVVLVRGGNQSFGMPHPGFKEYTYKNYTFVGTTLRGGINPGRDEFGGRDVNDVIALVKYLPTLESKIKDLNFSETLYMVGESRGGMEMFLALSRSSWLQNRISKAVSVVGLLDMEQTIKSRPDMLRMFQTDFQLNRYNYQAWLDQRNPVLAVKNIRKNLPILIVQGAKDIRVDLSEGQSMYDYMKRTGFTVDYIEKREEGHSLITFNDELDQWFER